jgi:hypothetical protein
VVACSVASGAGEREEISSPVSALCVASGFFLPPKRVGRRRFIGMLYARTHFSTSSRASKANPSLVSERSY